MLWWYEVELQVCVMALQHLMCPVYSHLLLRDKGNRDSKWLRFRIELEFIFNTPIYTSFTAKDQIALIVHWMGPEMWKLYYSWPEPESDTMELDIQHFLDHVTEVWRPVRTTMLERVKFPKMNRSQSQTGDDYMSWLKYAVLGCNFTISKERIRDQYINGINNQKYQEELLKLPQITHH